MTRCCGCPDAGTVVDATRHAAFHEQIAPFTSADYMTIWTARGMAIPPERTFVDDQFDRAGA